MKLSEPPCPRCPQHRPRRRFPSGTLGSYCLECNREMTRARSGHDSAERRCEQCGKRYRGNSRARSQRCPDCRTICVTCGNPKQATDTHSECHDCRAAARAGEMCITCGTRPRSGLKRKCWACYEDESPQRDRKFRLPPGMYDLMLETQHGVCAVCRQPEKQISKLTGKPLPLSVDHDRACCPGVRGCGQCNRGLVCRSHNAGLGLFSDDPRLLREAAKYIESYRRRQALQA